MAVFMENNPMVRNTATNVGMLHESRYTSIAMLQALKFISASSSPTLISARLGERLAGRRVSPSPDSFRQQAMEDFGSSPNPDGWGRFSTYPCIAAPIAAFSAHRNRTAWQSKRRVVSDTTPPSS
jgi:hypothetical protein